MSLEHTNQKGEIGKLSLVWVKVTSLPFFPQTNSSSSPEGQWAGIETSALQNVIKKLTCLTVENLWLDRQQVCYVMVMSGPGNICWVRPITSNATKKKAKTFLTSARGFKYGAHDVQGPRCKLVSPSLSPPQFVGDRSNFAREDRLYSSFTVQRYRSSTFSERLAYLKLVTCRSWTHANILWSRNWMT